MFCPKCGSILIPNKADNKKLLVCSCGYKTKEVDNATIKETIMKKGKDVEVIDKEINILPKMDARCPKCSHEKAYYWLVQTRAGDEPETKFLRCVKCEHTWRDYN